MPADAPLPLETPARGDAAAKRRSSFAERLGRLKDRADIARRDGVRGLHDRTAIAASTGRAQLDRAQGFLAFHARRRPILAIGIAATAGLILAVALNRRGGRRSG
jgi:ElaB/YqjD/DUF883 family membrane-anchored ribosome-binding protein